MPAPTPYSTSANALYPALYLYPLNDSFIPKHITLLNGQRVKIGRQTNAKTVPAERNGYFDSKVLSRQHAEVWEEGGKIFIKDVKSSNGTFINGDRLSAESLESEPYELKSDDIVEFGIDIVGEDNKTIIHHKVAARVVCVFTDQDVQVAARAEAHQAQAAAAALAHHQGHPQHPHQHPHQQQQHPHQQQQPVSSPSSIPPVFGFSNAGRRQPIQPQLGGMGGGMRPPGSSKSGLTVDHILSRLQGELQKSRDTGAELSNLTGTIGEIGDALGGNLPPNPPPYPSSLPPVRPPAPPSETTDPAPPPALEALGAVQSQLQTTQSTLASQHDKIRALETALEEHEALKREVGLLRGVVDGLRGEEVHGRGMLRREEETMGEEESDDDPDADTRSIETVTGHRHHDLESVQEEDEDQLAEASAPSSSASTSSSLSSFSPENAHTTLSDDEETDDERRSHGRPRTPEPSSLGMHDYLSRGGGGGKRSRVDELTDRLSALSAQLENALELSDTLRVAQGTIRVLEEKVERLEGLLLVRPAPTPTPAVPPEEKETLVQMLASFQKSVEGQWSGVRMEWKEERERLARARDEWEAKMRGWEGELQVFHSASASAAHPNGDIKGGGLVTPPSPRSLSSDSNAPRRRRRGRGSRSGSHGRSGSGSGSRGLTCHHRSECATDTEEDRKPLSSVFPITPESSVRLSGGSTGTMDSVGSSSGSVPGSAGLDEGDDGGGGEEAEMGMEMRAKHEKDLADANLRNASAAVGVLVLSVAAAAVLWRVRPE